MSAGGLVFLIWLGCVAVGVAVHHSPPRRRKRAQRALELRRQQEAADRVLAQRWAEAVAYHHRHVRDVRFLQVGLAHVTYVYGSYPRRGTKAIIRWYGGNGDPQDTWFELAWPRTGDWLVISGGYRYGWHNQNPNTLYAHIIGVVPAGAREAWERQVVAGQPEIAPAGGG